MNIINPYRFGTTPSIIPLANIISEYKFENNVVDTVGTNNGAASGITYADGLVDRTGVFNGILDHVVVADADNLSFTDGVNDLPFSISFLINFSAESQYGDRLIEKANVTAALYEYQIITSGYSSVANDLYVILFNSAGTSITLTIPFTKTFGSWKHMVFSYNGDELNPVLNIYIDGINISGSVTDNGYTKMTNTSRPVYIGKSSQYSGVTLNGKMDCLRFWNKELTQAEVSTIATDELNGIDINP